MTGRPATIALAAELGGAAIVDEIKGRRVGGLKQPKVPLIGSIEMFAQADVQKALGLRLADAIFGALAQARMHVLPEYHDWVVRLLGPERVAFCNSLPRVVRGRQSNSAAREVAGDQSLTQKPMNQRSESSNLRYSKE